MPPTARLISRLPSSPVGDVIRQRWALNVVSLLAAHSRLLGPSLLGIAGHPANIEGQVLLRALRLCIGDVPRVKLQQLARWALDDEFSSVDGAVDYRAALGRVTIPLLLIAGSADRWARPVADLILGRSAPVEVFPAVARWLSERAQTAAQEACIA